MTAGVRTTVGIVEWATRAVASSTWERAAADVLARHVTAPGEVGAQLLLVSRARRHAWRAEQWEAVIPALHDVTIAEPAEEPMVTTAASALAAAGGARDALAADDELVAAATHAWRTWAGAAAPVADVPYLRVVERVLADVAAVGR